MSRPLLRGTAEVVAQLDRPDRPAVTAGAAVAVLQQAIQRSELDAAVVAALAADVRDDKREGDGVA